MTHEFTYFDQAYKELKRVAWPAPREAIVTVALVFFVVILGGTFLFTLDELASLIVGAFIRLEV